MADTMISTKEGITMSSTPLNM